MFERFLPLFDLCEHIGDPALQLSLRYPQYRQGRFTLLTDEEPHIWQQEKQLVRDVARLFVHRVVEDMLAILVGVSQVEIELFTVGFEGLVVLFVIDGPDTSLSRM